MNLVRKYKIDKFIKTLDNDDVDVEAKCIKFLRDTFYNLKSKSYEHGKQILYSLPNNKMIFSYNIVNKEIYVNHDYLFRHNIIKIHTTFLDFDAAWDLILYIIKERFKIVIKDYYSVLDGNDIKEFIH